MGCRGRCWRFAVTAAKIPGVRFQAMKGIGHFPFAENPQTLRRVLAVVTLSHFLLKKGSGSATYAGVRVVGDNTDAPLAAFATHQALTENGDWQIGTVALDQRGEIKVDVAATSEAANVDAKPDLERAAQARGLDCSAAPSWITVFPGGVVGSMNDPR
jgi:hypothetical protein